MLNKHYLTSYSDLLQVTFDEQQKGILVADSGGTKTDWCLITNDQPFFFTTESYHPTRLDQTSKIELLDFWKQLTQKLTISCHFYGAGCSTVENQEKIKTHFNQHSTFKSFVVASDLVAAGIALHGNDEGYVGILGTGSVLTYYKNKQITDIIGGFGYLLGDEGSGYYFGKLVLQKYLNMELSEDLKALIEVQYGQRGAILQNCYSPNGKAFISNIQLHSENESIQQEINRIHTENIELFLNKYLPQDSALKEISFVGSYAFYQQEILKISLKKGGWKLGKVIQKPIEVLVMRHS